MIPVHPSIPVRALAPAGVRLGGTGGAGAAAVRGTIPGASLGPLTGAGPRVVYRMNVRDLRARLRRLTPQEVGEASVEVLRYAMGRAVDWMEVMAPVSTGRYLAAWQRGSNMAGCWAHGIPNPTGTGRTVRAVKANPHREAIIEQWNASIDKLRTKLIEIEGVLDAWYYSKGRPLNRWARFKQAQARTLERRLSRAVEELRKFESDEGALLFNAKIVGTTDRALRGQSGTGIKLLMVRGRTFYSARTQLASPALGQVLVQGPRAELWLVNREPHARLVEGRTSLARRARAFAAGVMQGSGLALSRAVLKDEMRRRLMK